MKFKLVILLVDENFNSIEICRTVNIGAEESILDRMKNESLRVVKDYSSYRVVGVDFREI